MQFVYQLPNEDASQPSTYANAAQAAKKQIKVGHGPFAGTKDGKLVFAKKTRLIALRQTRRWMRKLKTGQTLRVRDASREVIFWVRAVEPAMQVIDTNGNLHSDIFWSWIKANYSEFHPTFGGGYVCKDIAGTSTLSQHSYGNAVDVFFDTAAHQDVVYEAVKHGAAPVGIAHAISQRAIWEPGTGEHYYGGEPHYHLHCDFIPQYSGGCGVRG